MADQKYPFTLYQTKPVYRENSGPKSPSLGIVQTALLGLGSKVLGSSPRSVRYLGIRTDQEIHLGTGKFFP